MSHIIYFVLLITFIQDVVYPYGISGFTGLTIQNVVIYVSAIVLTVSQVATGRIRGLKIPGLLIIFVAISWVLASLLLVHFGGDINIPFFDNVRKAKTLVFEPLILYCFPFLLIHSRKQGLAYLAILVTILGLLNILTLATSVFHVDIFRVGIHYLEKDRFVGLSGNPNKTSYLLCVLMPFQYYFHKTSGKKILSCFYISLIGTGALTILLSGSRGGLLVLVLVMFLLAILWRDYKKIILFPLLILPIVLGSLWWQENTFLIESIERISMLASGNAAQATSYRSVIWSALYDVYTKDIATMLVGKGFGIVEYVGIGARAHNLYVEILVEFGAIGLISWFCGAWKIFRIVRKFGEETLASFQKTLFISMIAVMIAWNFTTLIGVLELIGLIIGIAISTLSMQSKSCQES